MMSHEEQQAQHDSVKNIERQSYAITVRQFVSLALILVGSTASVVTAFFHYDNGNKETYATKKDVVTLSNTVSILTSTVSNLSDQIGQYRYRDSVNTADLRKTVQTNSNNIARIAAMKMHMGFVTSKRTWAGTTFTPIK